MVCRLRVAYPWTITVLPYAENLVNLMVVDDRGELTREEMLRVLVPGGVALVRQGGSVTKLVKPPDTIDEWTHFLHSASNNPLARKADESSLSFAFFFRG